MNNIEHGKYGLGENGNGKEEREKTEEKKRKPAFGKFGDVATTLSHGEINDHRPLCDEHAAAQGSRGRFHDDQFLYKRHEAFEAWIFCSGLGKLAAQAMDSSTAHVLYDQLFVKEPGTEASTPWHNDTSYWHLRGKQAPAKWS